MKTLIAVATLWATSCAAPPERAPRLPFHVAVAPIHVETTTVGPRRDVGDDTELALTLEAATLDGPLMSSLRDNFVRVTPLADGSPDDWLREARGAGADLVLELGLIFHPTVRTSLNDRFWLNFPLYALGGPGTWFVNDRSYYFQVRLEAEVYDLPTASSFRTPGLDTDSQLLQMERRAEEASLDFLDRADGSNSFLLSLLVPSGYLARETPAVPEKLREEIADALCADLVRGLQERRTDLTRKLVDFYPEDVRVDGKGAGRRLVGSLVLELGRANELGALRYRFDAGTFERASWSDDEVEPGSREGERRRRYSFQIPLPEEAEAVQLEVEQLDADASKRSYTFRVLPEEEEEEEAAK